MNEHLRVSFLFIFMKINGKVYESLKIGSFEIFKKWEGAYCSLERPHHHFKFYFQFTPHPHSLATQNQHRIYYMMLSISTSCIKDSGKAAKQQAPSKSLKRNFFKIKNITVNLFHFLFKAVAPTQLVDLQT